MTDFQGAWQFQVIWNNKNQLEPKCDLLSSYYLPIICFLEMYDELLTNIRTKSDNQRNDLTLRLKMLPSIVTVLKELLRLRSVIYVTRKLLRYEPLVELFICCSVTSTINPATNLRFLPDNRDQLLPFKTNDSEAIKQLVCLFMTPPPPPPPPSLSLCWTTLELIKLRDELDCCDIPATFFYIKFIVARALFFPPPPTLISLSPFRRLFSLSLIKPGRSRQRLELSAGRWGAAWSR